jgi:hypothetical protein
MTTANITAANRDAAATDRRAAKLLGRDEDYREITYWLRESFKAHAKRQNRRNRRTVRRVLQGSV